MKNYTNALESVLKARLPVIDRWSHVNVHEPGEEWPHDVRQVHDDDGQHAIIHWHGNKSGKNIHPYELIEVPMKDVGILIHRNAEKLVLESKNYK